MIKTYCDMCGKLLKEDCSDQVNIDFNSYLFTSIEYQLCEGCAKELRDFVAKRHEENNEKNKEVRLK